MTINTLEELETPQETTLVEEADYPIHHYRKVHEISNLINFNVNDLVTMFSEMSFDEEKNALVVQQRNQEYIFTLDELSRKMIASTFGVSSKYLAKCPDDLAIYNFQYWLDHQEKDTEIQIEYVASNTFNDRNDIISFRPLDNSYISIPTILNAFISVFDDNDEIVSFDRKEDSATLTIKTDRYQVEVPGDGTANRPMVGDVTQGGLRITIDNGGTPSVRISPYSHRLVCLNGMTTEDHVDFNLKGTTIDELLTEVNELANTLLSNMDVFLGKYAATANVEVEGNIQLLLNHLAQEYNLGTRLFSRMIDKSKHLPNQPSVYDIVQIFTSLANETSSVATRDKLQGIGGHFVSNTQDLTSRCDKCEQLITS